MRDRTGRLLSDSQRIYASMRDRLPQRYTPRRRNWLLALIAVGAALVIVVTAVGVTKLLDGKNTGLVEPDQAAILKAGLITPGILAWGGDARLGAPDVFADPNQPAAVTGFEADLADAIAQKLHLTAQFHQVGWSTFPQALQARTIDLYADQVPVGAVPTSAAILTQPYYISSTEIVVRANDTRFTDLASLQGRPVGVVAGDSGQAVAQANPQIQMVTYGQVLPFEALAAGRLDAVVISSPLAHWYVNQDTLKRFKLLPVELHPTPVALALAATFAQAPALRDLLSQTLDVFRCDGTLQRLLTKWGLANALQTSVTKPEQACG